MRQPRAPRVGKQAASTPALTSSRTEAQHSISSCMPQPPLLSNRFAETVPPLYVILNRSPALRKSLLVRVPGWPASSAQLSTPSMPVTVLVLDPLLPMRTVIGVQVESTLMRRLLNAHNWTPWHNHNTTSIGRT